MKSGAASFVLCLSLAAVSTSAAQVDVVQHADTPIVVDGQALEHAWDAAEWRPLDKHMLGDLPEPDDFSGRFKLLWDEEHLYLLVEITDDLLIDQYADPLFRYWDDDCLEIFLDEDASGGLHQYDYNAFAYHIALDNQAVDIGGQLDDGSPEFLLLNNHLDSQWRRQPAKPHTVLWEVALKVFDDSYEHGADSEPVALSADKIMGFMLAYCDNDGSAEREHFLGSHEIEPVNGDKNLGYIDAGVFGQIRLGAPAD